MGWVVCWVGLSAGLGCPLGIGRRYQTNQPCIISGKETENPLSNNAFEQDEDDDNDLRNEKLECRHERFIHRYSM